MLSAPRQLRIDFHYGFTETNKKKCFNSMSAKSEMK
jgi:hypothetical protein